MNSAVGWVGGVQEAEIKNTSLCNDVCIGFTLARSHVQQKAVMGRWVQGQTRGPAEVRGTRLMAHTQKP